jgi:phosphate starvation-inducible protein PhoH
MTTTTHAECLVPGNHLMAGLLGTRDELLRQVEHAFPDEKIAVQGNRITVEGPDADRVVRLFDEAVLLLQSGQSLDNSTMARTIDMVRDDVRPSEIMRAEVAARRSGPTRPARSATPTPSPRTSSPSGSARRERESRILRWPRPCTRCSPARWPASS